jgi:carboxyl-terminal processing protease
MRILAARLNAPSQKPVRKYRRIRKALKWFTLISLLLVAVTSCLVLEAINYYLVDPQVTPVEIYHNTWQRAADNIYDQRKLKEWASWEHKFDHLIKTDADAVRYARQMIKTINDPYTFVLDADQVENNYVSAEGKYVGVGIEPDLQLVANKDENAQKQYVPKVKLPLRGSPAHDAGIFPNDVIVSIDGESTAGHTIKEIDTKLKGAEGSKVTVVVLRNNQEQTFVLDRKPISIPIVSTKILSVKSYKVGYLRIEAFDQLDTDSQAEAALKTLADCQALIVDVRSNHGGFIHTAVRTAAMFMDSGSICNETVRIPKTGYVTMEATVNSKMLVIWAGYVPILWPRPDNLANGRPVVLLIDGGSASAAELFAAALKDNKIAFVIGTETFGKGIGQTYIPVGNGVRLNITNIYGVTPNGTWLGDGRATVANGLKPDIVIERNKNSIFGSFNDNQLEAALEFLKSKLNP